MIQLENPSNISISYSSSGFFTILFNSINNASKYLLTYTNIHTFITNTIETSQPFFFINIPYNSYNFQIECTDIYGNISYSDIITYNAPYIYNIVVSENSLGCDDNSSSKHENENENDLSFRKIYVTWETTDTRNIIAYNFYNGNIKLVDIIYLSDTSIAVYVDKYSTYNIGITAVTEIAETETFRNTVDSLRMLSGQLQQPQSQPLPQQESESNLLSEQLPQPQPQPAARNIVVQPSDPILTFISYNKAVDIFITNYNKENTYRVYQYNYITSSFFERQPAVKNNRLRITELENGINYLFRVYAVNSVNVFSNPYDFNIIPQTIPQQPQIQNVQLGDSSIQISWLPSTNNGGSTILYYICQIYTESYSISVITENAKDFYKISNTYILHKGVLPDKIPYITVNNTFNTMNIYELENGKLYNIQILASNSIGSSSPSISIIGIPMNAPDAPLVPTVFGIFEGITVTWVYNINIIPRITGFKVFWKLESSTNIYDGIYYITNPEIKTHTISGLINDERYIIWIKAVNEYGDSLQSPFSIGIPYDSEMQLLLERESPEMLPVTIIYNNPLITFDYVREYLDKIQRKEINYESIVYRQADSIFSILNVEDISSQKDIFISRVLFKSRDNIIWLYNIIHPSYRNIKTSVCIMTTTKNKKYSNAQLSFGLNIVDINQFDEYEIMVVHNINDNNTYSSLEFEINKDISNLYIYKEIGDNITLLVSSSINNSTINYGTTYTNIHLQYLGQNRGRSKFTYTGPISRLIFSYKLL